MEIITSLTEMTSWSNRATTQGTIAVVPTMGCLHEGHLSLMRMARKNADYVVATLFVNPTQFGPNEDFDSYPRVFEADSAAAQKEGVDVLFAPVAGKMYPTGVQTIVKVNQLTQGLCGAARPGHFDGVTTVVAKLFNIVKPDVAIFGEKDFQQLAVIRQMVRDLNWDIQILGHPIVREKDGLAMSSRNVYLSSSERRSALRISQLIGYLREEVKSGERSVGTLLDKAEKYMALEQSIKIDYLNIVNDTTLEKQELADEHAVVAIAVKIGKTRLIDNGYLLNAG